MYITDHSVEYFYEKVPSHKRFCLNCSTYCTLHCMLILEKNLVDSVESIHSVESEVHNRLIIFFPKAPNLLGTRFIF